MNKLNVLSWGVGLLLVFTAQDFAVGAPPKTANRTLQEAQTSPLFKSKFPANQVQQRGLSSIQLSNGLRLNFTQYLRASSLRTQAQLKPLFKPAVQTKYLVKAPTYEETVSELADRLVIDRELNVTLKPGACKGARLPIAVKEMCFIKKPGTLSNELKQELRRVRAELRKAPPNKLVRPGVTAGEAKKWNNEKLLDLMLNTEERQIQLVSVLPLKISEPNFKIRLQQFQKEGVDVNTRYVVPKKAFTAVETKQFKPLAVEAVRVPAQRPQRPRTVDAVAAKEFPKRYFLTGFTIGREISDKYEYTFAKKSWWHDRYYMQLSYHFGAGFGLRFPFSVSVKSESAVRQIATDSTPRSTGGVVPKRIVTLSVRPVNVNTRGEPVYNAVNLDRGKYFKGKEFVLEVSAGCKFYASIPGPNVNLSCPSIDERKSRDINPVIGSDRSRLGEIWLTGDVTGLKVSAWVGAAYIDLGVGGDVTNGKIGMRIKPYGNTELINLRNPEFWLTSTRPMSFTVGPKQNQPNFGFTIDQPKYGFRVVFAPKVRARIEVDLGVYEFNRTVGPYDLDSLAVGASFTLPRHRGTTGSYRYDL